MEWEITDVLFLSALASLVAFLYSSVGHGGASGYLAILSLFSFPHDQMATSALCLNLLVSGMAFSAFRKAGHFIWDLAWPFILTSIPCAFLGGLLSVSGSHYAHLLASVLIFAAFRLIIEVKLAKEEKKIHSPPFLFSILLGAGIGVLSGIVGVGGGIFLSPLLILLHWANPKQTAATSAFFIFVNSFSGLLGRTFRQNFELHLSGVLVFMVLSAFVGGLLGSRLGAGRFSHQWLRLILAGVLILAAVKLLMI